MKRVLVVACLGVLLLGCRNEEKEEAKARAEARDAAKCREFCATNLGALGKAIAMYSAQHQGHNPPDLDALVSGGMATPEMFLCPGSKAYEVWKWSPQDGVYSRLAGEYAKIVDNYDKDKPIPLKLHEMLQSCYVYIPGQDETSPGDNVVLYEKKECHHEEGSNVLFYDCSTRWIKPYSKVEELVAKTKTNLAAGKAGTGGAPRSPH